MATIAGTMLAVAYVGLLGSFIIQMRWFEGPYPRDRRRWCFLIATAKGADTGCLHARPTRRPAQALAQPEPEQDDRGCHRRAALRGDCLASWSPRRLDVLLGITLWRWPIAVVYGLVIGVVAQLGDLMESMIKRDCERKDASSAVPGFGGVLDVLDSLLFAGPVAYGFWLWLWDHESSFHGVIRESRRSVLQIVFFSDSNA